MEYIEKDAAETFYLASLLSFERGIIGVAVFEDRMVCLAEMLDPDSKVYDEIRYMVRGELIEPTDLEENSDSQVDRIDIELSVKTQGRLGNGLRGAFADQQPVINLIIHSIKGVNKWEFHQNDVDPNPSVPHGHKGRRDHPKCDPYTGRVYDRRRNEIVSERLKRKTRVALWNNSKFREFALKAIMWYEEVHPYYTFRVPNPRRLPRRRR